ncbi:MAG TPA: histidine phosphatase family protein [Microbacterium sp.]|uniref:SixA phosphatase family protein n=1 Tax=Microbacterium sp. TaxID=51671 RepID=UPI002BEB8342|nr:histidine phosphatase family protein [Microbacterium sp.]HWI30638.1 histidine phosphatase family protein [Microbacterium sp.]
MKTLVLVRHAKSSWDDPGLDDHDRPLNQRGERDAPRMARRLAGTGVRPDAILSSTAVRALTTAEVFGAVLGVQVERLERLYGASPATIARVVAARDVDSVLVVAHDPGLSILAARLAPGIVHMPTCAVATFTWWDEAWHEGGGTGRGGGRDESGHDESGHDESGHDGTWGAAFESMPSTWRFDAPRMS